MNRYRGDGDEAKAEEGGERVTGGREGEKGGLGRLADRARSIGESLETWRPVRGDRERRLGPLGIGVDAVVGLTNEQASFEGRYEGRGSGAR